MTTNPPVTPLPGASLDLTNPGATSAAAAAALESVAWTGSLVIGRRSFNLVHVLPAITMVKLQQAQDSGQFIEIIDAIPLLVQHAEREALGAYLKDDPADPADVVTLDAVVDALSNGLEQIANRPSDK
jgi:hypothetical protein